MPTVQPSGTVNTNFKRAKLLIVEDNPDHWLIIKKAMEQCLPEVTPVLAQNGQQALAMFEEWQQQEWDMPKLIILDLYLPTRADGWLLIETIKRMPFPLSQIPIILLSSSSNPDDIIDSYQLGISSYIIKPKDFSGWLAYVRELRIYWWETVTLPPLQFSV